MKLEKPNQIMYTIIYTKHDTLVGQRGRIRALCVKVSLSARDLVHKSERDENWSYYETWDYYLLNIEQPYLITFQPLCGVTVGANSLPVLSGAFMPPLNYITYQVAESLNL